MQYLHPQLHWNGPSYYYGYSPFSSYPQIYQYGQHQEREEREKAEQLALLEVQAQRRAAEEAALAREIARQRNTLIQKDKLKRLRKYQDQVNISQEQNRSEPVYVVFSSPSKKVDTRGAYYRSNSRKIIDDAAVIIQRTFRSYLKEKKGIRVINEIRNEFEKVKSEFKVSNELTFDNDGNLSYTKINAPVHAYEDLLLKFLTKLDAVESNGNARVRLARKSIVLSIENELGNLDSIKAQHRLSSRNPSTSRSSSVSSDIADADICTQKSATQVSAEVERKNLSNYDTQDQIFIAVDGIDDGHSDVLQKDEAENGGNIYAEHISSNGSSENYEGSLKSVEVIEHVSTEVINEKPIESNGGNSITNSRSSSISDESKTSRVSELKLASLLSSEMPTLVPLVNKEKENEGEEIAEKLIAESANNSIIFTEEEGTNSKNKKSFAEEEEDFVMVED